MITTLVRCSFIIHVFGQRLKAGIPPFVILTPVFGLGGCFSPSVIITVFLGFCGTQIPSAPLDSAGKSKIHLLNTLFYFTATWTTTASDRHLAGRGLAAGTRRNGCHSFCQTLHFSLNIRNGSYGQHFGLITFPFHRYFGARGLDDCCELLLLVYGKRNRRGFNDDAFDCFFSATGHHGYLAFRLGRAEIGRNDGFAGIPASYQTAFVGSSV